MFLCVCMQEKEWCHHSTLAILCHNKTAKLLGVEMLCLCEYIYIYSGVERAGSDQQIESTHGGRSGYCSVGADVLLPRYRNRQDKVRTFGL